MILAHRAALNGLQLDSVDSRIIIQSIREEDGREVTNTVGIPGAGSRVTSEHRDSLDVIIRFAIRARKREMITRETVIEAVNAWAAGGGWLTLGHKPGRRLRVVLAQAPGSKDPWTLTEDYALTFRAYAVPYWQEENPAIMQRKNTNSATFTLGVNGSVKSVCEASFHNTSGSTVNTFSVDTGESAMSFSGLGIANGETLEIDHEDTGRRFILRARIKSAGGVYRSVLDRRSAASDDDLYVTPGNHSVVMTAGGTGTMQLMCAGRFL